MSATDRRLLMQFKDQLNGARATCVDHLRAPDPTALVRPLVARPRGEEASRRRVLLERFRQLGGTGTSLTFAAPAACA